MSSPFDRFSASAKEVVLLAQEAARPLKHNFVGTEHILLGLMQVGGATSQALDSLGVTPEQVSNQIVRIVGIGDEEVVGELPLTPLAKRVLKVAAQESLAFNHDQVEPDHILLALARENEGVGPRIMLDFGVYPEAIRDRVLDSLRAMPASPRQAGRPQADTGAKDPSEQQGARAVDDEEEPPDAIPTHSDRPAVHDELGRGRLAGVLGERMRRARGEDTEAPTRSWRQRRRKRRHDEAEARRAGSFMVHLHAPWGAGKSSLLNFLAEDLRNRSQPQGERLLTRFAKRAFSLRRPADPQLSQWIVVQFSAWEHQRLATPWWWLLAAVQRSCGRELWHISRVRWAWFWVRDFAWRLWNARAALIAALLVGGAFLVGQATDWFGLEIGSLTALQTAALTLGSVIAVATTLLGFLHGASRWLAIGSAEGAVRFLRRAHDPLGVYRQRFRWLVRSSRHPIAVFIDDLDRCKADYVVELLEGIQTIFAAEPVAYVVAADRTWLCESFSRAYDDFEESVGEPGRPLGFLFLEKTFQISLEIPPMSSDDQKRYWASLLRGSSEGGAVEHAGAATSEAFAHVTSQAEVEHRIADLISSGADSEQVLTAAVRRLNAPEMQEQLENLLVEFAPLLENNPRSMKRLMNAYGIERDRLLRHGRVLTKAQRRQLVLLTILRLRWPLFAEHLQRSPGDVRFCVDGQGAPGDHPFRELFADPDVRKIFDGSHVEERLSAQALTEFPGDGSD